jgi:hypothetical protein
VALRPMRTTITIAARDGPINFASASLREFRACTGQPPKASLIGRLAEACEKPKLARTSSPLCDDREALDPSTLEGA